MEDTPYESKLVAPTWLSGAVVRPPPASASPSSSLVNERRNDSARKWCGCEPGAQCVQCSFLHLQSSGGGVPAGGSDGAPSASGGNAANSGLNPWLSSAAMVMATKVNSVQAPSSAADMMMGRGPKSTQQQQGEAGIMTISHGRSTPETTQSPAGAQSWHGRPVRLLDLQSDTANSSDLVDGDAVSAEQQQQKDNQSIWQSARLKTDISMHPLYDRLLEAHVACLRIATPSDQLLRIDAQIAQAPQIISKYAVPGHNRLMMGEEKEELDQFMTHYVLLLYTFKEQLDEHARGHAMEAVMACWELEKSLLTLTGVSPGEGTGATMSDDDDDPGESDPSIYDTGFDGHDSGAYGPLVPTETERSLMERVRQELKSELKTGYKDRIVDVREEILRKRRAGKLPGDTTSVLKTWWQTHSKWPYPTEDEKSRLVEETGLQLKQINNWFINQRKRNWHSNPSSAAALKTKRKR